MLRAGALMVAFLVLAPFTEWRERGRLLLLCEAWPGHLKEHQQLLIASDNDSYKISVNRILEQSTLKKDNRNYKSFRMNFKIHGKSAIKNHHQKYAVLFKINLYLVGDRKTSIQISKKHLITFSNILRERNYLRRLNMLINANLKNCKVKMNWHINVRKIFEDNKSHASYFENGCKYMETRSPMSYMAHQANILRSEELLQKSQKSLGSIIILKFIKQHKGKEHIEANILKEKCKNSVDRFLASVKEKICKVNTNEYTKNLHRIVSDEQKIFNRERNIYIGFKSLQQEKNIKEKIKMWKQKTRNKQSIYSNQKLQFRHLFTYQRNSHIQKVYSTHKKMFNIQKKNPVFQTKNYKDKYLIPKWGSILRKESKFGENERGTLFKNCYMHFSTINLKFLTITICMKQEFFSSKKYQTKQLIKVKKMLRYLLPSSERVKKYFSLSPKALEMSSLKIPMVKWLVKKEGFPDLIYFYKDIFNGSSSTVERTKRSAKHKTESISVGALQHLSNALIAGATIFGIALFIIVLLGFYLYLKRRLVLKFFNTVLKDGKSSRKSKSTDSQGYAPISVSQNLNFVQPKDSRKKQTAGIEAHAKTKSDHVTVKEIYDSTDTEGSSKKSHRGLTVRSRAYVFPSRSNASVQSFYDDVCDICSAQFSLSDEFVEKPYSNLLSTTTKAKEAVTVACQTNHCLKDEQNYCINTNMSPQLKKPTISRSKSENDIVRASSSNTSRPVQSLTHVSEVQNP